MIELVIKFAISGYFATSLCLFAFPNILHRPVKQNSLFSQALRGNKVLRIAHRGGPFYHMQNTIQSFDFSSTMSDMLQMDVCQTKDGILVVHHDKSLARTCGIDKNVSQFLFEELPPFQERVQMHFAEKGKMMNKPASGIPTLESVFIRYPHLSMNIQIKTPSLHAIKQLKRLILKYQRIDNTIIGISSLEKQLTDNFPQSNRFFSYGTLPKLLGLYLTGLLPFVKIEEKSLQLPLYSKQYEEMRTKVQGKTFKNKIFFFLLKVSYYLCLPLVWHLRKRGVMTLYWVCNKRQQIEKAVKGGGCGVMSDDPVLLDDILKKM